MFLIEERQSPVYIPDVVSLMSENGQTSLWGSLVNVQPDPHRATIDWLRVMAAIITCEENPWNSKRFCSTSTVYCRKTTIQKGSLYPRLVSSDGARSVFISKARDQRCKRGRKVSCLILIQLMLVCFLICPSTMTVAWRYVDAYAVNLDSTSPSRASTWVLLTLQMPSKEATWAFLISSDR